MKSKQQGNFLLVLLLVFIALGAGVYYMQGNKAERRAAVLAQAAQDDRDKKAKEESAVTAQRVAAQKQTDAYTTALTAIDSLLGRWTDAEQIAAATGRGALAAPVAALQALKREADSITVPPCLDAAKPALLLGMSGIIEAYLTFMTNSGNIGTLEAQSKFSDARPHFVYVKDTRAACPPVSKP